jgi:CheY-like chemotaxis protein
MSQNPACDPTVLLVDDDAKVRETVHQMLLDEGLRVVEASDGPEALERFRNEPGGVDLLLTDIEMPGMNGLTLSTALGKEQHNLKTVYVSGFPDLIAEAEHIPANFFLQKPFTSRDLFQKIRAALNTPLRHWRCPDCGGREYQGVAAENDGHSQMLRFTCADCGIDYLRTVEAMYAEGAKCPFCRGPTVPSGNGFAGPEGQFYLGHRCNACGANITEHSPNCPAIPW